EPNEFRLDRSSPKNHLAFGKGVHFCVGAALARLEARVVLGMLLDRTSWIEATDVGEWLPSILVRRDSGSSSPSGERAEPSVTGGYVGTGGQAGRFGSEHPLRTR
ncbi:cytochrome P450, partial [Mycolicibacterium vaccae]|nr:cytochrome P450 [Mycolicibacterium vaccae]